MIHDESLHATRPGHLSRPGSASSGTSADTAEPTAMSRSGSAASVVSEDGYSPHEDRKVGFKSRRPAATESPYKSAATHRTRGTLARPPSLSLGAMEHAPSLIEQLPSIARTSSTDSIVSSSSTAVSSGPATSVCSSSTPSDAAPRQRVELSPTLQLKLVRLRKLRLLLAHRGGAPELVRSEASATTTGSAWQGDAAAEVAAAPAAAPASLACPKLPAAFSGMSTAACGGPSLMAAFKRPSRTDTAGSSAHVSRAPPLPRI